MMDDLYALELILGGSVKRKPEHPLTNSHLLNMVKMARRLKSRVEEAQDAQDQALYNEVMEDRFRYGSGD